MADRAQYLAALTATNNNGFTAAEISKRIGKPGNIVRAWLSRDKAAGLVGKTEGGKYYVISNEALVAEIQKLKRNSATGGSTGGSRGQGPATPQLCRLHNLQFYAKIPGGSTATLPPLLSGWDEKGKAPNTRRWQLSGPVPGLGVGCKVQVSAGPERAGIQIWLDPVFCNSYKIHDQLEASHAAAQDTLKWLSYQYKLDVALLEIRRQEHFAIKIPVTEGYRLQKLYGMREGKVWINSEWWIDASYGDELETANERAFSELMDGLQKVGKVDEAQGRIEKAVNELLGYFKMADNPAMANRPQPPKDHEPGGYA